MIALLFFVRKKVFFALWRRAKSLHSETIYPTLAGEFRAQVEKYNKKVFLFSLLVQKSIFSQGAIRREMKVLAKDRKKRNMRTLRIPPQIIHCVPPQPDF